MLSKSFKFLAMGMSLAGLIACGKGMGKKNNLKIDGTYVEEGLSVTDSQAKTFEKAELLTIVDIKDNIQTRYRFSSDKNGVEITRQRLIINGDKIVGTEDIINECIDQSELGVNATDIQIEKQDKVLDLTETVKSTDEKDAATVKLTSKLKKVSDKETQALPANAQSGKIQQGCVDLDGVLYAKVEKSKQEVPQEKAADQTSDKATEEKSKEVQSEESDSESSSISTNEADLKADQTSAEQQLPEGVSEIK